MCHLVIIYLQFDIHTYEQMAQNHKAGMWAVDDGSYTKMTYALVFLVRTGWIYHLAAVCRVVAVQRHIASDKGKRYDKKVK